MSKTNEEKIKELARKARNEYRREYRKNMTPEQKEKQRQYAREWQKKNKDRMKKHQEDFWLRKARNLDEKENPDVSIKKNELDKIKKSLEEALNFIEGLK